MALRTRVLEQATAGNWGQGLLSALPADQAGVGQWLCQQGRLLKSDKTSLACLLELQNEACFAKLYRHKHSLRALFPAITARRSRNAFSVGSAMHRDGVNVVEPLCCLLLPEGALLLTQALEATDSLAVTWYRLCPTEREAHLLACAGAIAAMHGRGYAHGDCKWQNLVPAGGRCFLVDLDAARQSAVGSKWQVRDIARFTVNAEEQSVDAAAFSPFLDAYFDAVQSDRERFLAAVAEQAQVFRRRHRHRYGTRGSALL